MRTTLDIEIDVLQAAKELAARENTTAGKIITRILRQGVRCMNSMQEHSDGPEFAYKNGIRVLGHRDGPIVTLEHVRQIMDEEGI